MLRDRTDELEKRGTQHGGVMCDELKFKTSFYSNFKDGTTVAMAASSGMKDLSLAIELEHLIERENQFDDATEEEASENYADATHVNSFRLKTSNDFSHNGEYFYNDGSLKGDDILGQILWVITCYEIVDVQIHGTNMDAGGNNTGAINALRHNNDLPDGWLSEEYVSFKSPISPDRWIWLMLCNVHNFKNYRTALHSSKPDGKRFFTNKNGTSWSWKTLQYIYQQDKLRSKGGPLQTALRKASVEDLDKLTCMRVHLAKHIFEYKTVTFALFLIAEQMGLDKEQFKRDTAHFGPTQLSEKLTAALGYLRAMAGISLGSRRRETANR